MRSPSAPILRGRAAVALDPAARVAVAADRLDAERGARLDHRRLEGPDERPDEEPRSAEPDDRVGDELAGAVVRDLAAALDADDLDAARAPSSRGVARTWASSAWRPRVRTGVVLEEQQRVADRAGGARPRRGASGVPRLAIRRSGRASWPRSAARDGAPGPGGRPRRHDSRAPPPTHCRGYDGRHPSLRPGDHGRCCQPTSPGASARRLVRLPGSPGPYGATSSAMPSACPTSFATRPTSVRSSSGHQGRTAQPPGTWSDDGALMLATLDGLLEPGRLDPGAIAQRYLAWYRDGAYTPDGDGRFDIGRTTQFALDRLAQGVPAAEAGPAGERDCGNGSLMRVLPIALASRLADEGALAGAPTRLSNVTHGHPAGAGGVRAVHAARPAPHQLEPAVERDLRREEHAQADLPDEPGICSPARRPQ